MENYYTNLLERSFDIVKALLAHPNMCQITNQKWILFITKDANKGNINCGLLLHPDIDPNIKNKYGRTPLLSAFYRGDKKIVKALLTHPTIDPNIKDQDGKTPLHYFFTCERPFYSPFNNFFQIAKLFWENPNIDVNIKDKDGRTPLLCAFNRGDKKIVKALLTHPKIDTNIEGLYGVFNGGTVLHQACWKGHTDIVKALLAHPNINVNLKCVYTLHYTMLVGIIVQKL